LAAAPAPLASRRRQNPAEKYKLLTFFLQNAKYNMQIGEKSTEKIT
jgi:hypothetical protein